MTREEAIKTLKGEAWTCCAEKWNEALDMAIAALEQEPKIGQWLHGELIPNDITGHYYAECSICKKVRIIDNFCPNCGSNNWM